MGRNDRRDHVYSELGAQGMIHDCCYCFHCSGHSAWEGGGGEGGGGERERERELGGGGQRILRIVYNIQ